MMAKVRRRAMSRARSGEVDKTGKEVLVKEARILNRKAATMPPIYTHERIGA
jgi:hypothetical protein